jgi:hypothetical protein
MSGALTDLAQKKESSRNTQFSVAIIQPGPIGSLPQIGSLPWTALAESAILGRAAHSLEMK